MCTTYKSVFTSCLKQVVYLKLECMVGISSWAMAGILALYTCWTVLLSNPSNSIVIQYFFFMCRKCRAASGAGYLVGSTAYYYGHSHIRTSTKEAKHQWPLHFFLTWWIRTCCSPSYFRKAHIWDSWAIAWHCTPCSLQSPRYSAHFTTSEQKNTLQTNTFTLLLTRHCLLFTHFLRSSSCMASLQHSPQHHSSIKQLFCRLFSLVTTLMLPMLQVMTISMQQAQMYKSPCLQITHSAKLWNFL